MARRGGVVEAKEAWVHLELGVLGAVTAWDADGATVPLKGPRHRAVLARLIVAGGRVVPVRTLVDDLWDTDPPANAVGALQTFVSALRRALEPDRAPRTPATLIVTEGLGYALRVPADAVDARRFEAAVEAARTLPPRRAVETLDEASTWWRGPAYADFTDEHWARSERSRLAELRLGAVELRARSALGLGLADAVVPDLDAHVTDHPWREEGWRLLALALYRTGRQKDALDVVRRARSRLVADLGLEPGPELHRLETDILRQAARLEVVPAGRSATGGPDTARVRGEVRTGPDAAGPGLSPADEVWSRAAATYGEVVAGDARARLRSSVELLRSLAVTGAGGLEAARQQRLAGIRAAEELDDPDLTARVIGAYDVPAIWSRSDDPEQAAAVVTAAERALAALPGRGRDTERARLLTTVALESRGSGSARARDAARRAEALARRSGDPALLAFALNGVFMQSFHRAGLAARRDAIGAELVDLAERHGLDTYQVLGHLVRMQALSGLGDLDAADRHAVAADLLAARYGSPLVTVFTTWFRALRRAETGQDPDPYRDAATVLDGAGMPGLHRGLVPLARLAVAVRHGRPVPTGDEVDPGPYEPWVRPLVLIAQGEREQATAALRIVPDPPADHLLEALWCLVARAAVDLGEPTTMRRAITALTPAAGEIAGAGSGLVTLGPVAHYLDELS